LIHHQFESIHPFYDGNGRTGRILNVLYLVLTNCLNLPILYLSRFINNNKSEYYRLLQAVRDENLWEERILFILKAINYTSISTIQLINDIKKLMLEEKHQIRTKLPKIYSQDLINNIFKHPYTKIEFIISDLKCDRQTARKYLEKSGIEGVVLCDVETRARVKIKTQEFIERHRFISNITPKSIWERLKNGETLVDMNIPDEFLPQVKPIYEKIVSDYRQIKKDSFRLVGMTKNLTNKAVALNTSLGLSEEDKHLIFFFRRNPSGDEVSDFYWNKVKPKNCEEKA